MEFDDHVSKILAVSDNPQSNLKVVECCKCYRMMTISKEAAAGICWSCTTEKAAWPEIVTRKSTPKRKPKKSKPDPICTFCGKPLVFIENKWKCPDKVLLRGVHAPAPKKIGGRSFC